jgi:hypothetical protein
MMASFARDLGYEGPPFRWDEGRRAQLRAELDAWYARAYGLSRDELRYILDPADVKGRTIPPRPSAFSRLTKSAASANTAPVALSSPPTINSRRSDWQPNDHGGTPARLRGADRGAEGGVG